MNDKKFYVYILATQRNGTFYVGLTTNLLKRVWDHKQDCIAGFTRKYGVHNLVYYEIFEDSENAARRERRLKKWNKLWKMRVIEEMNPEWKDLYETLMV